MNENEILYELISRLADAKINEVYVYKNTYKHGVHVGEIKAYEYCLDMLTKQSKRVAQ
jgi:hypothetical protein